MPVYTIQQGGIITAETRAVSTRTLVNSRRGCGAFQRYGIPNHIGDTDQDDDYEGYQVFAKFRLSCCKLQLF
jgi:hypothetical protein